MYVYVLMIIFVIIVGKAEYTKRLQKYYYNKKNNKYLYKATANVYLILLLSAFCLVGGLRFNVGSDYVAYARGYYEPLPEIIQRFKNLDEPIIYLITWISRSIWNEGTFVIFVESVITVFLVFKGLREQEKSSYVMPLVLYILYCGWISSFGAVRQCLAASLIFAFSKKRDNKLWILKYLGVCLLAYIIHKSAIFMFPILLIANRKFDFIQVVLMVLGTIMLPYIVNQAAVFMDTSLTDTEYAQHSVNTIRIVVACAPALLAVLANDTFKEKNRFVVNMAILNALISYNCRNSAMLYRFYDFSVMYLMLFIPRYAENLTEEYRKIFSLLVYVLFFIYFYYEVNVGNGALYDFQWAFGKAGVY